MTGPLPDLNVKVTGDSDDAVAAIARVEAAEESLGKTSGKTKDKIKSDSKESSKAVDDFAKTIQKSGKDGETAFTSLGKAITAERDNLKKLQADFKSGNGNGISLFGDIKKSEADLSKLMGFAKTVGLDIAKDGEKAGQDFTQAFGESFQKVLPEVLSNPYTAGALAAGVALLAPGISAEIGGAVAAGFGLGVIGLGALSLKSDPRFKGAIAGLKTDVSSVFKDAAQPLLTPLVSGFNELGATIQHLKPEFAGLFSAEAPAVAALSAGVSGFAEKVMPGLVLAAKGAAPVLKEIGAELPELGTTFGDFMALLTGSKGDVDAIKGTFKVLDATLLGLGLTFNYLANVYHNNVQPAFNAFGSVLHYADAALFGFNGTQAAATVGSQAGAIGAGLVTMAYNKLVTSTNSAGISLEQLVKNQVAWQQVAQQTDDLLLSMYQAETAFNDALKKGGKNWDESTKAGQAHVAALNADNEAITHYYDSLRVNGQLTEKQTTAELNATTALYKQAKQAGATKDELATLKTEINQLRVAEDSLHDKNIKIHFETEGTPPSKFMHGLANSGIAGYANSGVAGAVPHYDATGVYAGGPQPLYRFAEQSTRREALIAENGDGNRADAALREAASWRGMEVVPAGGGSSSARNGGGITVLAEIYIDSKKVATALVPTVNRKNGRAGVPIFGGG